MQKIGTITTKQFFFPLFLIFAIVVLVTNGYSQNSPEVVVKNATFIDHSGNINDNYRCVTIGDKGYIFLNNYSMLLETGGTSKTSRILKSFYASGGFVNMVATNKYLYFLFKSDGFYYLKRIDPVKDEATYITSQSNGNPSRFFVNNPNSRIGTFPNIFAFADRVCFMYYTFNRETQKAEGETYFSHDTDETPKLYVSIQATSREINFYYATPGIKFNMVGDKGVFIKANDLKLYTFEFANTNLESWQKGKMYLPEKNYDIANQKMDVVKITTVSEKNIYVICKYSDPAKNDSSLLFELSNKMNFICKIPSGTNYIEGNNGNLYLQSEKGIYQLDTKSKELVTLYTLSNDEIFSDIQTRNKRLLIENGKVFFGVAIAKSFSSKYLAYDLKKGYTYELAFAIASGEKAWLHVIGDYYYYLRNKNKNPFEYEIMPMYDLVKLKYTTGEEQIIAMPLKKKESCDGILDFVQVGNTLILNVYYRPKNEPVEKRVVVYKP